MKKLTILSAIIILNSFAAGPLGAFSRPEDHVVIKGNIIKSMINFPVSNIRVYSVKDRKITLIPFQIDKVDIDGKYVLTDKEAKEKAAA